MHSPVARTQTRPSPDCGRDSCVRHAGRGFSCKCRQCGGDPGTGRTPADVAEGHSAQPQVTRQAGVKRLRGIRGDQVGLAPVERGLIPVVQQGQVGLRLHLFQHNAGINRNVLRIYSNQVGKLYLPQVSGGTFLRWRLRHLDETLASCARCERCHVSCRPGCD